MRILLVFASFLVVARALPQRGYGNGYGYETPASTDHHADSALSAFAGEQSHKYLPPATTTPASVVHKQFYVVGPAQDQSSNEPKVKRLVLGRPQRNYRVVFIKAPDADNANTKYYAEPAPKEEKTVIYVLSKKAEDLKAEDIATPAPTTASKPEVFFIKYKTDEEATYAQKEIQGQYDQLGGTNEFSDESAAPITSVVGSLDGLNADGSYDYKVISKEKFGGNTASSSSSNNNGNIETASTLNAEYLPAAS